MTGITVRSFRVRFKWLCLYLKYEGVQLLPQYDTYEPQIITYVMLGGELDRHTIHTILKWMSSLYGVTKTQGSLVSVL